LEDVVNKDLGTFEEFLKKPKQRSQQRVQQRDAQLIVASDVIPKPKDWLWEGHLLRGALELLSGLPGLGKSQVQINLVACVSAGLPWPDGTAGMKPANVIMLTAEDTLEQEVVPRLLAAKADLTRVHILKCIKSDGAGQQFFLGEDLDVLEKTVAKIGNVALITIDPITAYMGGKIDSHKTTEVRSQLGPLKDFAERMNVAISAITHPPKSSSQKAIDHFIGSQAFIAAGRIGHVCIEEIDKDGDKTGRILFANAKNNPHTKMPTLAFRVVEEIIGQDEDSRLPITAPHVV
jgi:putative DNA primase/helicase